MKKVTKNLELGALPETVWEALTNPEKTKAYFFGCEAISDWSVGSTLDYRCEYEGQPMIVVTGEVRAIEPGKYLEVTCRSAIPGTPAEETIATYTLTPVERGTRLEITQGEFADEAKGRETDASWDQVLGGLKALVEGGA